MEVYVGFLTILDLVDIRVPYRTVTVNDFEKCDLIVIFGNNPGTNHPRMLTSLQAAKGQDAKIIAVNPLPETGLMRVTNPNPQDYPNPLDLPLALLEDERRSPTSTFRFVSTAMLR